MDNEPSLSGFFSVISAQCSECQRGEKFKQSRTNGRSNHDFLEGRCRVSAASEAVEAAGMAKRAGCSIAESRIIEACFLRFASSKRGVCFALQGRACFETNLERAREATATEMEQRRGDANDQWMHFVVFWFQGHHQARC